MKTSNFLVEALPTSSVNISLSRSDCGRPFGLFEEYINCVSISYFSINSHDEFLRFSSSKMANPEP